MIKQEASAIVGIFMPAYNQGKYIDEAIESLKKQTFQDFEVHIVDDGSDDGVTPKKLASIDYEKARVFLDDKNIGVALRAREHYKMFKTKYVLVLCADDILCPTFLEKTVDFLEKHPNYGAVGVNVRFFRDKKENYYYEKVFDESKMFLPQVLARNQVLGSSLMRKKALDEINLSNGPERYQDWDRWISMLEMGWKIGLVPEFLFYYRQLPVSLSHSATIEDELEVRKRLVKKHAESYKKYYDDVIINMESIFLEMQEGKNWLEGQYETLNEEIARLNGELKNRNIVATKRCRLPLKIKAYLRRIIKRK